MLHIIKDLSNPYNWIKLARNPSKFKKVFNDRINYYPGLKYGYTKSKIIKKLYINFNMFLAKKNKQFDDIFFKPIDKTKKVNISFNMNNRFQFNEQHYESLKENGALVLEKALPEQEHEEICKKFNKIKNDIANAGQINSQKIYQVPGMDAPTWKSPDTMCNTLATKINPDSTLAQISNQITKIVYGQSIISTAHYMYTRSINLPDRPHAGDNVWHSDRYLPNLKLIYYPFGVKTAPFRFSLGSHKINRDYLDFFINNSHGSITLPESKVRNSEYGKKFLKNPQELVCAPNTLAAAFTSGFHGRTPFQEKGDRSALFLCYPNFNLLSLISFWRYNS